MESNTLLTLVIPTALEDTLVDWLLEREEVPGFTSLPVSGHGSSVHSMSLQEQVTGRKRHSMFQIYLPEDKARTVLDALKEDCKDCGIHYWLTAAADAGRL